MKKIVLTKQNEGKLFRLNGLFNFFLALLLLSTIPLSTFCQTNKTFNGKLANFGDEYLEAALGDADAAYGYYLDGNEKIVFNGDFKASKIAEMVDGVDKVGYTSNVSTKFFYRVSGKYDRGKKVGLWKSEKIIFGMKISGASYNAYQNNWNTLNVDNSSDIESIKTITINYSNDIPDGSVTETISEKGKIVQSIICSIKNNRFVGKFTAKNDSKNSLTLISDYNIDCNFDSDGFLNGDCIQQNNKNSHNVKFLFCHGILLNAVEHVQTTGEKTAECINPMYKFLETNPKLPPYIKIDSIEIGSNTYTGGLSIGVSTKNTEGVLCSNQFAEKNKNIAYGVNANCIESLPAISELNCAFINKVNFKKHKDIFFVCDSIYADKQYKGVNLPLFIDKVNMYRADYYKIMFTDASVSELPYFPEDLRKVLDSKFGLEHAGNFGFSFFRILVNKDGSIGDVILKRIKTEVLLTSTDGKTETFNQDKYDLSGTTPLEDSFVSRNVLDMPKWVPGKDSKGNPISAYVDIFLWSTNNGVDVWVKNEKGYYIKNPIKARNNVKIGMAYLGGIVAYVLQPGENGYDPLQPHGLLAATSDQSAATVLLLDPNHSYFGGQKYTDGIDNVHVILAWNKKGDYAAYICDKLNFKEGEEWKLFDLPEHQNRHTTAIDENENRWHLPSLGEIKFLYNHKDEIGGFTSSKYWSSSVEGPKGIYMNFTDGKSGYSLHNELLAVRAVKYF